MMRPLTRLGLLLLAAVVLSLQPGCRPNRAPLTPGPPRGASLGVPGMSYQFRLDGSDPDGDSLSFRTETGGDVTEWVSPQSGETLLLALSWQDTGHYEVRAQARDEHGAESEWSPAAAITLGRIPAPDLALPDLAGNMVRLDSLLSTGPAYLVWWDLPCVNAINEVSALQPLYDSLSPNGFSLLAISVDKAEDEARVRTYAAAKGWHCPVLLDSTRMSKDAYGIIIKPTGILVSMDTLMVYGLAGFHTGDELGVKWHVLRWMP